MKPNELLDAREAACKKVVTALQDGKKPEENDTVAGILEILASAAAGHGFDEGVRFMESSQNVKVHTPLPTTSDETEVKP
jgi:hypothetical protein